MRDDAAERRVEPGDVLIGLFLLAYVAFSLTLLPFEFHDLRYLLSLEQGRWVMQEWVHPIYVPVLDLLRTGLALFGYEGPMLIPVELLNVAAASLAFVLLHRLARRFSGAALTAAAALSAAALSHGFWFAAMRPTPDALGFLYQTLALLLLISDGPTSWSRYALAGALAGVSMGFHLAAIALGVVAIIAALAEPQRTRGATVARIAAFVVSMAASAAACWLVLIRYRNMGREVLRNQDLYSILVGIEQMRGTPIYRINPIEHLSTLATTLRWQTGGLLLALLILTAASMVQHGRSDTLLSPFERRVLIIAAANFAAIAGFFLINNAHSGFIFTSLTLVPVVLAVLARNSRVLLVVLLIVTLPDAIWHVQEMRMGPQGHNDPLLVEVRFLQKLLGPHDVLLTPGTPFPEVFYLAHLNVFELSLDGPAHPSPEVPVVHPGAELRARIAWWRENGGRVFYAAGDETTDFAGTVSDAIKARQMFWRSEAAAGERAPKLRALRAALGTPGIEFRDGVMSPNEERYAEISLSEWPPPLPPPALVPPTIRADELRTLFLKDRTNAAAPFRAQRATYLMQLARTLPDDPWHPCDVMQLICSGQPRRGGQPIPCEPSARCVDQSGTTDVGGDTRARNDQHAAVTSGWLGASHPMKRTGSDPARGVETITCRTIIRR